MVRAYHFLESDMTSSYGTDEPWKVGETRKLTGEVGLCVRGFHSSPTPFDALGYAQGPVLCLVDVSKPAETDTDKQVSRRRTLVAAVDVTRQLHEAAIRIALDVLPIYEKRYPEDERPRKAIETKQLWLDGNASDEELAAARDAAREAARDAARGAARDAAWAAAWDAAWAAAWDAAWAAARGAAWAAARGAARDAAWAAAWDAAWDAARGGSARDATRAAAIKKYRGWINDMLLEARAAQEASERVLAEGAEQ